MPKKSPTARTLDECDRRGWKADIVERKVARRVTKDCYGFGDIIALDGQPGSLLIQATSGTNHSARVKKLMGPRSCEVTDWLRAGNRAEVWSWRKSARTRRYELRREAIVLGDEGELERVKAWEAAGGGR